jgi:hypothetical protein
VTHTNGLPTSAAQFVRGLCKYKKKTSGMVHIFPLSQSINLSHDPIPLKMSSFLSSTPGDIHSFSVAAAQTLIQKALDAAPTTASPDPALVAAATASLPSSLPESGLGDEATFTHLLRDLAPGFNGSKLSANYYGFITGGVLPIAEAAENVVTAWDQNVQVHLPTFSVCTAVEDAALSMLGELVELQGWTGRTFTTGATGSNVLGLACGREAVVAHKLRKVGIEEGVAELGMLGACQEAGIREIQVLTSMGHSSLYKAASIVGLGRRNVREVGGEGEPWKVDLEKLEKGLQKEKTASIVVISCGEVNTGRFATAGLEEVQVIRDLCDKYEAWLHVDGGMSSLRIPDSLFKADKTQLLDSGLVSCPTRPNSHTFVLPVQAWNSPTPSPATATKASTCHMTVASFSHGPPPRFLWYSRMRTPSISLPPPRAFHQP